MARGFALFTINNLRPKDGRDCVAYNLASLEVYPDGEGLYGKPAFHTLRAKASEEIYEFWSVVISTFSLASLLAFELLKWFFSVRN